MKFEILYAHSSAAASIYKTLIMWHLSWNINNFFSINVFLPEFFLFKLCLNHNISVGFIILGICLLRAHWNSRYCLLFTCPHENIFCLHSSIVMGLSGILINQVSSILPSCSAIFASFQNKLSLQHFICRYRKFVEYDFVVADVLWKTVKTFLKHKNLPWKTIHALSYSMNLKDGEIIIEYSPPTSSV